MRGLILLGISLPVLTSGCSRSSDERLAQFAEQSVQQQSRQNEAITSSVQELTRATDNLVKADAVARQELLSANQEQQTAFREANAQIEQSRQWLEQERANLAEERAHERDTAAKLSLFVLLAPVLLPLALVAYLLFLTRQPHADDATLPEVLLSEIISDSPRLHNSATELPHMSPGDSERTEE